MYHLLIAISIINFVIYFYFLNIFKYLFKHNLIEAFSQNTLMNDTRLYICYYDEDT